MDRSGAGHRGRLVALLACSVVLLSGCYAANVRHPPTVASCNASYEDGRTTVCRGPGDAPPVGADSRVANDVDRVVAQCQEDLTAADELDRQRQGHCVDLYYRATLRTARALQISGLLSVSRRQSAWEIYHQGLSGLIDAGQRYGQLNPRGRLTIQSCGTRVIPISYHGFAWQPEDFSQLVRADTFQSREISDRYASCGLGLTLVGVRIAACPDEVFFRPRQPFAVTAVLRPITQSNLSDDPAASTVAGESVLEFYNPHVSNAVDWDGAQIALARDLTAPLAAVVSEGQRQYLRGFTAPSDTSVKPKLVLTEPYQRGKIPVVFIHGMYSDPITWADTINGLRSQIDLYQQYQFWVFRYPTGGAVLESGAALRDNLRLVRQVYNPQHDDAALDAMVLVGHSLGGLLAKMQIVNSYDLLWNQAASQPFGAVRASAEMRLRLNQNFFFEPLPFVSRVVFIGTPHRGSALARRLAGRLGSSLVKFGTEEKAEYRELMDDNRDIFNAWIVRSRPTSVDFVEPTNPFLIALEEMPVNPATQMHSIVGTGGLSLGEPGDGVVTVRSARVCGVQSELLVSAKHEKLHRHPDSIAELARILRAHAAAQSW